MQIFFWAVIAPLTQQVAIGHTRTETAVQFGSPFKEKGKEMRNEKKKKRDGSRLV